MIQDVKMIMFCRFHVLLLLLLQMTWHVHENWHWIVGYISEWKQSTLGSRKHDQLRSDDSAFGSHFNHQVERERREEAASGLEIAQVLDGFVSRKVREGQLHVWLIFVCWLFFFFFAWPASHGLRTAALRLNASLINKRRINRNVVRGGGQVIKQTIMTTVYGVTRYGARQQIRRQLDDIADFPQRYSWEASFYLTDKTFKSLQEMFSSTKEIQVRGRRGTRSRGHVCGLERAVAPTVGSV